MQIHTKVTMEVNLNRKGVYSTIGKTISETMTESLNFANQLIKEATMQSAQIEMRNAISSSKLTQPIVTMKQCKHSVSSSTMYKSISPSSGLLFQRFQKH